MYRISRKRRETCTFGQAQKCLCCERICSGRPTTASLSSSSKPNCMWNGETSVLLLIPALTRWRACFLIMATLSAVKCHRECAVKPLELTNHTNYRFHWWIRLTLTWEGKAWIHVCEREKDGEPRAGAGALYLFILLGASWLCKHNLVRIIFRLFV